MMLLAPARGKAVSSCSPAMYDALLAVRVAMRSRAGRHRALAAMPVAVVVAALAIPLTGLGRYLRCSSLCFSTAFAPHS